jgi:hypothetical protein
VPKRIREADWREVCALFADESDPLRNAEGWAKRYGVPVRDFAKCKVTLEAWTNDEIDRCMSAMSEFEPRMTVDICGNVNNAILPPRLEGLPLAVVRFGDRYGMIDGKHRANKWKHMLGNYAVLVIHA